MKAEKDKEGKEKIKVGDKDVRDHLDDLQDQDQGREHGTDRRDEGCGSPRTYRWAWSSLTSTMEVMGQKIETTMELKETGNKK